MWQLGDIDAASGDIGRHQHTDFAFFKVAQRARTGTLALVAVDGRRRNAIFVQLLSKVVSTVLGTGEDQHLLPVITANQERQQFTLTLLINHVNVLSDLLGSGVAARHRHFFWIVQQLLGQAFDLVREGSGEQQVLTLGRQFGQHATDIVNEAHIQHTVGFIQHQDLNFREVQCVLMFQVQQTARCCHQHVNAAAQFHHLRVDAHAAEDHQRTQIQVLRVILDVFPDLSRKLTGWG